MKKPIVTVGQRIENCTDAGQRLENFYAIDQTQVRSKNKVIMNFMNSMI